MIESGENVYLFHAKQDRAAICSSSASQLFQADIDDLLAGKDAVAAKINALTDQQVSKLQFCLAINNCSLQPPCQVLKFHL